MNVDQQQYQKKDISSIKESLDFILHLSAERKINAATTNQSYNLIEKVNEIPLCILLDKYNSEEKVYGIEIYFSPKKNGKIFLDYGCEVDTEGKIYYNVAVQSSTDDPSEVGDKIRKLISHFEKKTKSS